MSAFTLAIIFDLSLTNAGMFAAEATPSPITKPISSVKLPCDQASDFIGTNIVDQQQTCQDMTNYSFSFILPSSAAECSATLPNNPMTKAEILQHMYSMCCEPGSKPNPVCELQARTATPCKSKAKGEFLPRAT